MKIRKKEERLIQIRKLAYELAQSGECSDFRSVEIRLRGDGFIEARSELDNDYFRKELDDMCKIAISEEEINNRQAFKSWL